EPVAALNLKLRALAVKGGEGILALHLEQQGQFGEAATAYHAMAEHAPAAQDAASAYQMLANVYERQQRFDDAASAQRHAVARLEAAGTPDLQGQLMGARETLARYLQQSGHADMADAVYRQLLAAAGPEQEAQVVFNYASHLCETQRAPQALAMLKE